MVLFPQHADHEATSSENLVLLHDLRRRIFEPKLLFMVAQVAVIIDVSQIKKDLIIVTMESVSEKCAQVARTGCSGT